MNRTFGYRYILIELTHTRETKSNRTFGYRLILIELIHTRETNTNTTVGYNRNKTVGYGVATISRLLKIISLFCRISSLL